MKILLVAPDMSDLNTVPEIRSMSAAHRVHVLNGVVTVQNVHDAVVSNQYDGIHFATHIKEDVLQLDQLRLSGDEVLDLNGATRLARLGGAKLIVFNICLAARFATYMVRNGVPCVIYTTVNIQDRTAWQLPAAFYEQCRRAEAEGVALDFRGIFDMVDDGDGTYGILSSSGYFVSLLQEGIRPLAETLEAMRVSGESTAILLTTLSGRVSALEHKSDPYRVTWVTYVSLGLLGLLALGVAGIALRMFL